MSFIKKSIIILTLNLIWFSLFAEGFGEKKRFDVGSVSNFNISLVKENITVSTFNGNEICVISVTDDKFKIPSVELKKTH